MSNSTIRLADAYEDGNGILRWISNDRCVPVDCLDDVLGKTPYGQRYDRQRHAKAVSDENAAFIAAYLANPPQHSPEDLAEARRELGDDAIDCITGKRLFAKVG